MSTLLEISEGVSIADVMHPGLFTCPVETPLRAVAKLMAAHRVHCIVVFDYGEQEDEDRELWGIVSDLDLAEAAAGGDIDGRTAGSTAATPVLTVHPEESLGHAARLMAENGCAHLVVVDRRSQRPVGVLSTLDLARALSA